MDTRAALADLGIDVPPGRAGNVKALCPRCSAERKNKRDRCLSVDIDEGIFHCHHCEWSGKVSGNSNAYGSKPPPAYARPTFSDGPLDAKALAFLAQRGITEPVWRRNRLRSEKGALCYPYLRDGEVVNVKFRAPGKRFYMAAGAELTLYGVDDIPPAGALVWVEGEMDKLAVEVAGIPACVSVPNGAPAPSEKDYTHRFDYFGPLQPRLEGVERHIIAVDADAPGQRLAEELTRRLGPERCWAVTWPDGCKDANDVLMHHGPATLRAALDAARPLPVAGLHEVDDFADEIDALYDRGLDPGEAPWPPPLSQNYRVRPGLWTLVTGMPSMGKSAVLDWMLVQLAQRCGWRIAVCSFENQPLARHAAGLMQLYVGRPFGPGPTDRMSKAELHEARDWLGRHFTFILPDEDTPGSYGIDGILSLARAAVVRFGIRGLVIDPWNELEHMRDRGVSETEHVNHVLTKIRRFARAHGVHVWLVAHPTKLQRDPRTGQYPVPTLSDVSGSAHFRAQCDSGSVVWRDLNNERDPVQVHVQKIRWRETGQISLTLLDFDKTTGRYYPHDERLGRGWTGEKGDDEPF